MKITWLGQAGLLIEAAGKTILVDPYLSNSVYKINPANDRRVPVDERFWAVRPDVIVCTHNHLDHTDPETLEHYLKGTEATLVLAPFNAWNEVRKFGPPHNYVMFNRHTEFSVGNIRFAAVKAEHSDLMGIGVIIEAEGKKLYITGDTLYNTEIFADIPADIDAVFLPVNGLGNNMNMEDAKRFCEKINPHVAVPMHCGLFDDIDMNAFAYERRVVPQIYQEITLF